jgi:hypothetical protein
VRLDSALNETLMEALLASIEASKSRDWRHILYGDATIATLLTEKFKTVEGLAAASLVQLAAVT